MTPFEQGRGIEPLSRSPNDNDLLFAVTILGAEGGIRTHHDHSERASLALSATFLHCLNSEELRTFSINERKTLVPRVGIEPTNPKVLRSKRSAFT